MKVLRNAAIFTFFSFFKKGITFILMPLYTYFLSPADYGVVNTIMAFLSLISLFVTLNMEAAATRFFFKYKDNQVKVKEIWGTLSVTVFIMSLLVPFLIFVFNRQVVHFFIEGIDFYPYLFIGLFIVFIQPLGDIYKAYLKANQKSKEFSIMNLVYFIVYTALLVLFIVVFKYKVRAFLYATLISHGLFFIYSFIKFIPQVKLCFRPAYLKEMFKYSIPLLPHHLSSWVTNMIDKIFLNNISGAVSAGLYSVGAKFGIIQKMVVDSVDTAFTPWFFEEYEKGEEGVKKIIKFADAVITFTSFFGFVLSIFSYEIIIYLLPGNNFDSGWKVVPWIAFSFVFHSMYNFFNKVFLLDNTKKLSFVSILGAGLNIGLNLLLIPKFGFVGAAIATTVSYFIRSIIALIVSKDSGINFNWVKMYLMAFSFFLFSGLNGLLQYFNVLTNPILILIIKVTITTLIVFVISKVYSDYWQKIMAIIKRKLRLSK